MKNLKLEDLRIGDKLKATKNLFVNGGKLAFILGHEYTINYIVSYLSLNSEIRHSYLIHEDGWLKHFELVHPSTPQPIQLSLVPKEQKVVIEYIEEISDLLLISKKLIAEGWIIHQIIQLQTGSTMYILYKY